MTSRAKDLINQLSNYVDPAPKAAVPENQPELEASTPGDEVEDLASNIVDDDKDAFHETLNSFCNRYDPSNEMTIKDCINKVYEEKPKDVERLVNKLLAFEFKD